MQKIVGIIGAGLSGLICAQICKKNNWPFYLLASEKPKPNGKKILLNLASLKLLHQLGITPRILTSYPSLLITQRHGLGHLCLRSPSNQLAYAVSYHSLLDELCKNLHINIESIESVIAGEKIQVKTNQHQHTFSNLLVCDGKKSICRSQLNIKKDVGTRGYAKIIQCETTSKDLELRFSHRICGAILPGNNSQIIFTGPPDLEHCEVSKEQIQAFFPNIPTLKIQNVFGFDFQSHIIQQHPYSNILFLGDAAVTVSPVAAQGFNHFLSQAAVLSQQHQIDLKALQHRIHLSNLEFFNDMNAITTQPIKRHLTLTALPLFQNSQTILYQFGNRYA
jgi:2-polyprenyl-6-methoxyphenol hydroxylase-like FAD-dependent oxidoreductase